jgi:hypothetical protein
MNIIELIDAVIIDAQYLLNKYRDNGQAARHLESVINAGQFIRDEMKLCRFADRSAGNYTATRFANVKTSIYLLKKKSAIRLVTLNEAQLARLEAIETNLMSLENQLSQVWGTKNPLW